jgi:hypothetical protein
MSHNRFRQIARLEKLAEPHLEARRQTELKWRHTLQAVVAHGAILAFLIRHGIPKIDEPLSASCRRVSESNAWRECRERFPWLRRSHDHLDERDERKNEYYSFDPHSRDRASIIGSCLRYAVISTFRGADEKEKLNSVFASAPPWLIWFTFADYTAGFLGLTPPDLSRVTGFARSQANFDLWYGLPSGAFEPTPWANGPENEPLACTNLDLVRSAAQWPERQITSREQKRARTTYVKSQTIKGIDDWPRLIPAKFFEMSPDEALKLLAARSDRQPMWSAGPGPRAKLGSFR